MKAYKHIVWDWNGTLLDDVDIVIDAMNILLKKRGLPLLDIENYRDKFTFPVKQYYEKLGFDFIKEPFEELAREYISEIGSDRYKYKLYDKAENILNAIKRKGIDQSILSACEEKKLLELVDQLGIKNYFIKILGLNDHYAISKVERGKNFLNLMGLKPDEIILIGDTSHDYEVSRELGCDCILISNGHQSHERLNMLGIKIFPSLNEVVELLI